MQKNTGQSASWISISVVSHLQLGLVTELLGDLDKYCAGSNFDVILTLNVDEPLPFGLDSFSYPVTVLRNPVPLGFSANHNQAFASAGGQYFCVMNPDIRINSNPFEALCQVLENPAVGVVAPLVLGDNGDMEDSARRFPRPLWILGKALGRGAGPDYAVRDEPIFPDWVGGMCMLFARGKFEMLGGFDQRYFLYYEDVDICGRLRLLGYEVVLCPKAKVIHHAQRSSHTSFRYLRWHLVSMMRFFLSPVYWRLRFRSWTR